MILFCVKIWISSMHKIVKQEFSLNNMNLNVDGHSELKMDLWKF